MLMIRICIYLPIYNSSDLQFVQDDIKAIEQWSTNNFLTLNSSKCEYMLNSRRRNPTLPECLLILNNCILKNVDTYKYIGVLLSKDLSCSSHIRACNLLLSKKYPRFSLQKML